MNINIFSAYHGFFGFHVKHLPSMLAKIHKHRYEQHCAEPYTSHPLALCRMSCANAENYYDVAQTVLLTYFDFFSFQLNFSFLLD